MAQYSTSATGTGAGWTATATADGATLANSTYQALKTWTATSVDKIVEVYVGGEATSSAVGRMVARRHSTQSVTPTNITPAALSPFSAAAAGLGFVLAGTGPTAASTAHLLNLGFNAFGGVVRWVAAPGEEIVVATATQPNNELSISSQSGSPLVTSHMIFEEL